MRLMVGDFVLNFAVAIFGVAAPKTEAEVCWVVTGRRLVVRPGRRGSS